MIAGFMLLVVFFALGTPAAIIGIPWTIVMGDISLVYRWAMAIMKIGLWAARIDVRAEWRGQVDPNKTYLFFSNHLSNLDPPVLLPLLPGRTAVFIKRPLLKIPVLGYGMKLADFIAVDRDGSAESARQSVELAEAVVKSGVHVTTFVEGTRSSDGRLLPFKKGPFYLAMDSGAPIIPVTIRGTDRLMRKGSIKIRSGAAQVIFHTVIEPKSYATREELMVAVRRAIEED
jgi:1-acyl-sn-glycerol-3-phosphate acyltransferase